jgi:hypothetical protein
MGRDLFCTRAESQRVCCSKSPRAKTPRVSRLGESMRRVEYREIAVAALTIVLVSTLLLAFVF